MQQHPSRLIKDEHVNRPMPQLALMHLGTRRLADHPIKVIDDIEDFIVALGLYILTQTCPFVTQTPFDRHAKN